MSSSRSILFPRGRFQGWSVSVVGDTANGRVVRTMVQLETPGGRGERRSGVLYFLPGVPGFEETSAALTGGVEALEHALEWVIEATAKELRSGRVDDEPLRAYWQRIVDDADHSRATWYAEHTHDAAFEVVGLVLVTV